MPKSEETPRQIAERLAGHEYGCWCNMPERMPEERCMCSRRERVTAIEAALVERDEEIASLANSRDAADFHYSRAEAAEAKLAEAEFAGWRKALTSVEASLISYPNGSGDLGIMKEVERLLSEARRKGMEEMRERAVAALQELYRRYKREERQPMDFGRKESIAVVAALPLEPEGEGGKG